MLSQTHTGWYQVIFQDTVGWVASGYVKIVEGDIDSVPFS